MGKIKGGPQGAISGRTGNLIFYNSGDKNLVRTVSAAPYKFSEGQKANQSAFGIRQRWLNPITAFLKVGCRNNIPYMGGPALAMKYLSANAVSGEGPEMVVLPEKVLVTMGNLPGSANASAVADGGEVLFTWDPAVTSPGSAFDQALLLAYDGQKEHNFLLHGVFRRDGGARLPLSTPGLYHCYLGFAAEDRSQQSDSQYLGTVVI